MRVTNGKGPIKLAIVCCLHGNEVFGKTVYDYYDKRLEAYPRLRLLLANEEAYDKNIRYLDKDLNTVFPGNKHGNHEQRLATQILPLVRDVPMVLDIHTTSSDLEMVPIIGRLNKGVERVIHASKRRDVAQMMDDIVAPSLIGNIEVGVSLEFGEKYITTVEALKEVSDIVDVLFSDVPQKARKRRIFKFGDTIPLDLTLDKPTRNFVLQPTHEFYPFLFDEKSNEHDQGFAAYSYEERLI